MYKGPSIKYVTLFLTIFTPPLPPVTNCHKTRTPPLKYVTLSNSEIIILPKARLIHKQGFATALLLALLARGIVKNTFRRYAFHAILT